MIKIILIIIAYFAVAIPLGVALGVMLGSQNLDKEG
jgi:hypothetical protein